MTQSTAGQNSKESTFAQKVLNAFRLKSFDTYKQVVVNPKDFEELIADIQKHDLVQRQSEWKQALENFNRQADSKYNIEFKRMLEKGESLGIDWALVNFSDFIYQTSMPANSSKTSLTGHINFTVNNKNYVLFGLETTEFSNGYKLSMLRTVQKGDLKMYIDPDLLDDDDT